MKKLLSLVFILTFSGLIFSETAFAQAANTVEVKTIDAHVKKIDAFVKRNKSPQMIFGDTAYQGKSKWKQFASEKALEKFREKTETYEIIYVWKQTGRIVETSSTLFSPSGDWAQYVYHYFRENGSLAKVESDFRSFNGDIIIEQSLYFDGKGKQIKKSTQYRDLKTKKFKKVKEGDYMSMGKFDIYKTVKKLPFAHLLPQEKKSK